jgi:hypothetical protein
MAESMRCPFCNCKVKVPDYKVGKTLNCPRCYLPFIASMVANANPMSTHAKPGSRRAEPQGDADDKGDAGDGNAPSKKRTDTHPVLSRRTDTQPALAADTAVSSTEAVADAPKPAESPQVEPPPPPRPWHKRLKRYIRKNAERLGIASQLIVIGLCLAVFFTLGFSIMKIFRAGAKLDQLTQVKVGMTLREVEDLLGPGEVASMFTLRPEEQNVEGATEPKEIKVVRWQGEQNGRRRVVNMCFENGRTRVGFNATSPPAPTGTPVKQ